MLASYLPRIDYFEIFFYDYIVLDSSFGYLYFPKLSKSICQIISKCYVK